MKNFICVTFSLFLLFTNSNLYSQCSGGGTFQNYSIDCDLGSPGFECASTSPISKVFICVVPADGDMEFTGYATDGTIICCDIPYTFTCTGGVYTKGGVPLHYFGNSTSSFTIPCLSQGDTLVVKFSGYMGAYGFSSSIFSPMSNNDIEPNNYIASALPLAPSTVTEGHIGHGFYINDGADYYKVTMPSNGELVVTADFEVAGVLRLLNQGNIVITSDNTSSPGTASVSYSCLREGEIFYISINRNSGECSGYELSYTVNPTSNNNDAEPNNTIASALTLAPNTTAQGHIGHGYYTYDGADYYKVTMPSNGELVVTADFEVAGVLRLLNQGNTVIASDNTSSPGTASVSYSCLGEGEIFYISIIRDSGECSGYELSYTVNPPSNNNDAEPNNTIASALTLAPNTTAQGHIDHGYYTNDGADYYEVTMPSNGELVVTADFEVAGVLRLLNQGNTVIASDNTSSLGTASVSYSCLGEGEIFYISIIRDSGECSGYELSYTVNPPSNNNDAEPNNTIASALTLAPNTTAQGHIGHGYYTNDGADYYKVTMPSNGELVVTVDFEVAGTLRILTQGNAIMATDNTSSPGTASASFSCLGDGEIFYISINRNSGECSGYELSYSVNPPLLPNDLEPNDTKSTAQLLAIPFSTHTGHIDFGYFGYSPSDNYDYLDLGNYEVGDSIHFNMLGTNSATFNLYRENVNSVVNNLGTSTGVAISDDHIVTVDDNYYIRVNGNCSSYSIDVSGEISRQEFIVDANSIELPYDYDDDRVFIRGDFTGKTIYIINSGNFLVQSLNGLASPIIYNVNALPPGQHFLVIRDFSDPDLEFQNLIKE